MYLKDIVEKQRKSSGDLGISITRLNVNLTE